jgi:hypothetical protein
MAFLEFDLHAFNSDPWVNIDFSAVLKNTSRYSLSVLSLQPFDGRAHALGILVVGAAWLLSTLIRFPVFYQRAIETRVEDDSVG